MITHAASVRRAIWLSQGRTCCWCTRYIALATATLEHLIPRSWGGTDARTNLAVACKPCNDERGPGKRWPAHSRFGEARVAELLTNAERREAARRKAASPVERLADGLGLPREDKAST